MSRSIIFSFSTWKTRHDLKLYHGSYLMSPPATLFYKLCCQNSILKEKAKAYACVVKKDRLSLAAKVILILSYAAPLQFLKHTFGRMTPSHLIINKKNIFSFHPKIVLLLERTITYIIRPSLFKAFYYFSNKYVCHFQ